MKIFAAVVAVWIVFPLLVALAVLVFYRIKKFKGLKERKPGPEESKPKEKTAGKASKFLGHTVALIGLVAMLDFMIWAIIPWLWSTIYSSPQAFAAFNIGFLVMLFLITKKDGSGKEIAGFKAPRKTVTVILVIGLITAAALKIQKQESDRGLVSGGRQIVTSTGPGIPISAAAFAISFCESGGKQFEENGKTPLKNVEGSSAAGKYQFIEAHKEPAKKLGFDLDTEEGQDGYARYRLIQNGFKDWEADPRSKTCIANKLGEMGFKDAFNLAVSTSLISPAVFTLVSPVGEWSRFFFIDRDSNFKTDWISSESSKHEIEYTDSKGKVFSYIFPTADGKRIQIPGEIIKIRVKSLESKPVPIKIEIAPKAG